MRKTLKLAAGAVLAGLLAAALALPRPAAASVSVDIHLGLPAAPPLVVVEPGVQVVEDWGEEVYFSSGWYWVRREEAWYRARRPSARFVLVERRLVPAAVVRLPPGQYVKYKKAKHGRGRHDDHGGRRGDDRGHDHRDGHGKGHGRGGGKHGKHD